ncbi:RNA polymerase sigma factor [Amycolatopsis anabasis]|uniref:RNA polymerase sigma factor n=1 Tax=Amycolatopsis anabasis TaxID=1840409 RepID=UPI00131B0827|nr:RNA polymerase sigma factor [Amycolatopsis anabasis]
MAEFEKLYRSQVAAVTAFFARRTADPQAVADLTSDTFVHVITSFGTFDPAKGTVRSWVFGIARRVYARHCEAYRHHQDKVLRLAGRRPLESDEMAELADRIDAERAGRELVAELATLPSLDREIVELVDIAGLKPAEAAHALGASPGSIRMRLMRARARLRKIANHERSQGDG